MGKDANIVDVDLNEVLRDSLESVKLPKSSSDIDVVMNLGETPPIRGNRSELRQVFVNLLNNSSDAMPNGGKVVLFTRGKDGVVEVEISDTGVGIPGEHIAKIFDPFFTTKDPGKGTGLGLYVVSMILRKHHGTIEVHSSEGEGTTFTLRFPSEEYVSETRSDVQPVEQET